MHLLRSIEFFFFNDAPTTEISPLSLHDALPISPFPPPPPPPLPLLPPRDDLRDEAPPERPPLEARREAVDPPPRSEEHTSELQSRQYLVCRLLLEKKKKI